MVNDHDFLDIAQHLNTRNGANDICRCGSATSIPDDESLIVAELEEMVGTASGVAARYDANTGAGPDRRIMVFENILHVVFVGGLEIEGHVRVE